MRSSRRSGRADPLPPHARLQHAVAAGHRPRRHRHADRRRARSSDAQAESRARPRPRRLRRARVGVEAAVRRHHHAADAPPGRVGRLVARALHDGRRPVRSGRRNLRAPVRRRPDLPRQAAGELGPGAEDGGLRPRSRERRRRTALWRSAIRWATAAVTLVVATTRPETMLGDVAVRCIPTTSATRT